MVKFQICATKVKTFKPIFLAIQPFGALWHPIKILWAKKTFIEHLSQIKTQNQLNIVCIESYLKDMGFGAAVWEIFFCYSGQKILEAVLGGCVLIL